MSYSNVKAVSEQHGELPFKEISTAAKNVRTTEATGSFGTITVNEIEAVNHRIWHSHFSMKTDMHLTLTLQDETPSLRFLFTLKDNMRFYFNELGKGIRLKHEFNLLYNPNSDIRYTFRKDKEYAAVVIFFRYEWLHEWKHTLPDLAHIIENIELGKPFLTSSANTPQMRNVIHELMSDPDKRWYFVDAKVNELLNLVVRQLKTTQSRADYIKLTSADIQKIEAARDHLAENVVDPGTIPELSKRVGLNEFKLKWGFKKIVGFTIHDFVLQERMALATKYLKQTEMDLNQIATIVGFWSLAHFSKAFKKKFGYSPRSVRK